MQSEHLLPPDRWGWLRSHLPGVPPPAQRNSVQHILTNSMLIIDPTH